MSGITSEDALDAIGKAVGWCDNPDPDDPDDAIAEVQMILWRWVRGSAGEPQ